MDWTNLAGFLIVAVPAIMLGTHGVAWLHAAVARSLALSYARTVLAEALKDDPAETLRDDQRREAKPYTSHEEWRADLWSGDIETAIYRAQKGVPPKVDPEAKKRSMEEARRQLAAVQARLRPSPQNAPPVDLGEMVDRGVRESQERTRMDGGLTGYYPELLIGGLILTLLMMK